MQDNLNDIPLSVRIVNLTALVFLLTGIILIGSFVYIKTLQVILGIPVTSMNYILTQGESNLSVKNALLAAQASTAIISFIVLPLLITSTIWKDLKVKWYTRNNDFLAICLAAILVTLISIPLIAYLTELNKDIIDRLSLSDALKAWISKSESDAEILTNALVLYGTSQQFIYGLVVVAVLPAIGEELLFRGIIQTHLAKNLKNFHVAIFLTGVLFSFIHFQFYGFLPRMFLGVLFGYIYYWSGSLLVPILMHFTNNAFSYIGVNLYHQKKINVDLDKTKDIPITYILFSALFFLILLVWIRKRTTHTN